jgi:hypothetical protein
MKEKCPKTTIARYEIEAKELDFLNESEVDLGVQDRWKGTRTPRQVGS